MAPWFYVERVHTLARKTSLAFADVGLFKFLRACIGIYAWNTHRRNRMSVAKLKDVSERRAVPEACDETLRRSRSCLNFRI